MNVLDAAHRLGREFPGGVPALAQRLGVPANTLYGELNPNHPTGKLGVQRLMAMMAMSGDYRPLHAMCDELGHVALALPAGDQAQPTVAGVAQLTGDFARLLQELASDMSDGQISDNELKRIEAEWLEMQAHGSALMAHLRHLNRSGKPADVVNLVSDRAQARS